MNKKILRWGYILLCLALVLTLLPAAGLAEDDGGAPPMKPWGYVYVNGELAEDGTPVTIEVDGLVYGPYYTVNGYYLVEDGIPKPPYVDDKVYFFVFGIMSEETRLSGKTWRPGTYHLDLHITKAHLETTIVSPTGVEIYSTEQPFEVVATIENTGKEDATDVAATLTISPTGSAEVVSPTVDLNTIPVGGIVTATWMLTCTAPGPTEITVAPT